MYRNNDTQSNARKSLNPDNCGKNKSQTNFSGNVLVNLVALLLTILTNFSKIDKKFCQK